MKASKKRAVSTDDGEPEEHVEFECKLIKPLTKAKYYVDDYGGLPGEDLERLHVYIPALRLRYPRDPAPSAAGLDGVLCKPVRDAAFRPFIPWFHEWAKQQTEPTLPVKKLASGAGPLRTLVLLMDVPELGFKAGETLHAGHERRVRAPSAPGSAAAAAKRAPGSEQVKAKRAAAAADRLPTPASLSPSEGEGEDDVPEADAVRRIRGLVAGMKKRLSEPVEDDAAAAQQEQAVAEAAACVEAIAKKLLQFRSDTLSAAPSTSTAAPPADPTEGELEQVHDLARDIVAMLSQPSAQELEHARDLSRGLVDVVRAAVAWSPAAEDASVKPARRPVRRRPRPAERHSSLSA